MTTDAISGSVFSPKDREALKGVSNGGYHYFGRSTSTKRTSEQVRRRDGAGRGLDIPARMHG